MLARAEGILGTLPIVNVGVCSVPLDYLPRSVAQRTGTEEEPSIFSIEAAEARFNLTRLAGIEDRQPVILKPVQIVGMNRCRPGRIPCLFRGEARVIQPAPVE